MQIEPFKDMFSDVGSCVFFFSFFQKILYFFFFFFFFLFFYEVITTGLCIASITISSSSVFFSFEVYLVTGAPFSTTCLHMTVTVVWDIKHAINRGPSTRQ